MLLQTYHASLALAPRLAARLTHPSTDDVDRLRYLKELRTCVLYAVTQTQGLFGGGKRGERRQRANL